MDQTKTRKERVFAARANLRLRAFLRGKYESIYLSGDEIRALTPSNNRKLVEHLFKAQEQGKLAFDPP
ncbi:MAG: hypothetical protein KGH94_03430 [Candidatus Micrarchaeota archaeon]|nr:hypothetical protein [Candidatus Micrarchaeota archaeon]